MANDRPDRTAATSPLPQSRERTVAIALSHDLDSGSTPTVVAKGHGELAEKILALAFKNDVKVRSDPDLAQILSVVEVDCEIPVEAFAAVAEILTYVYRLNQTAEAATKAAGAGESGDVRGGTTPTPDERENWTG
jgi:flagellar biosynthesis protein